MSRVHAVLVLALVVVPASAVAQDGTSAGAPWGSAPAQTSPIIPESTPMYERAWPVPAAPHTPQVGTATGTSTGTSVERPEESSDGTTREAVREPSDPGAGHFFQMPTARVMRMGDVLGHYVGDLGWVGARFGLTRRVDVGVGVPYYFVGVSADVRVAFVQRSGFAASWWGYASVPLQPNGSRSTTNLGFTWSHAGMGWITGPLISLWGERAGFHAGVHFAQRTGLGGMWLMTHATVEFKLVTGMKLLGQAIAFYELAQEAGAHESDLVGNARPRFLPYVLGGLRFYTRRFSADFGVLAPLDNRDPLYTERLPVLPWVSLAHLF